MSASTYTIEKLESGDYRLARTSMAEGTTYVDLKTPTYVWPDTNYHYKDCLGTLKQCRNIYKILADQSTRTVVEEIAP